MQRGQLHKAENLDVNSRSSSQVAFVNPAQSSLTKRTSVRRPKGNFVGSKAAKLNFAAMAKGEDKVPSRVKVTGADQDRIRAAAFIAERLENVVSFIRDKEAKHDTYSSPTMRSAQQFGGAGRNWYYALR